MNFINTTQLKLTYVRANGPDPDDTVEEYLTFPGAGVHPRLAYTPLKGSATSMTWPQGSVTTPFVSYFPNGPNLVTDPVTGDTWGVRSWEITAEPSFIPGRLEIAWYLYTNGDNSTPDSSSVFDLDFGSWGTGPLTIYTGDYSGAYYRECRYRFVPGPLVTPLGV